MPPHRRQTKWSGWQSATLAVALVGACLPDRATWPERLGLPNGIGDFVLRRR